MRWQDRISIKADVCHGRACLKGRRVLVSVTLATPFAEGDSPETIIANYPPDAGGHPGGEALRGGHGGGPFPTPRARGRLMQFKLADRAGFASGWVVNRTWPAKPARTRFPRPLVGLTAGFACLESRGRCGRPSSPRHPRTRAHNLPLFSLFLPILGNFRLLCRILSIGRVAHPRVFDNAVSEARIPPCSWRGRAPGGREGTNSQKRSQTLRRKLI